MKPILLIVDDDISITQQLFWTLCDYFDVLTANDVQSAVRRIAVYEPSVAILDLNLSTSDSVSQSGLKVLSYMRERLPDSSVFILSSEVEPETRKLCLRKGARAVLTKPFKTQDLISTLLESIPVRAASAAV